MTKLAPNDHLITAGHSCVTTRYQRNPCAVTGATDADSFFQNQCGRQNSDLAHFQLIPPAHSVLSIAEALAILSEREINKNI
ncbi:hypothetical protein N9061_01575 [bacterium]|nr:hypothetical protein [bacterium]